jgi:hypothetical protein
MPAPEELSRQTLAETPARALTFLSAVGQNLSIREVLLRRGYSTEVHEQIWRLLLDTSGFRAPSTIDARVRAALVAVDQWDEPNFRVAAATLRYEFPDQYAHVFADDLQAGTGPESLVAVTRFLDRLDELERSPERKATRKVDAAALAKLALRGLTVDERVRVRELVNVARSSMPDTAEAMAEDRSAGRRSLELLRAMYEEWAEIARVEVKRRADLIRLGLAKRKKSARAEGDEVDDETATPPPVAVAPAPVVAPVPVAAPAPPVSPAPTAPTNGASAPGAVLPS